MTRNEARTAARNFIAAVTNPDAQWSLRTVERYMPKGWRLDDAAVDGDFMPLTVKNAADAIFRHARRA